MDPFLLIAHHRHWFDPFDPLRPVFRTAGKALGLPYLPNEGFDLHPHRGFEIATYILDGCDGFRHRDSLGNECVYRGGSVQWMRAGSGVMHEEMWETLPDRRTSIELFQIWINLPRRLKMEQPYIRMLGQDWGAPFAEQEVGGAGGGGRVRTIAGTVDGVTAGPYEFATPLAMAHVKLEPDTFWHAQTPPDQTSLVYVREGEALVPTSGPSSGVPDTWLKVPMLTSAKLQASREDCATVTVAAGSKGADFLFLAARPHGEPVANRGPVVMNYDWEVRQAFQELQSGTFLKR